jgi:hypothetical protein
LALVVKGIGQPPHLKKLLMPQKDDFHFFPIKIGWLLDYLYYLQKKLNFFPIKIKWPLNFPLPKENKVAPPDSFHWLKKQNLFFPIKRLSNFPLKKRKTRWPYDSFNCSNFFY